MKTYPKLWLTFLLTSLAEEIFGNESNTRTHSLNVILNPADEACFYQYFGAGETINVEYKVMTSTYQDHVIGFQLSDNRGRPLVSEFNKQSSKSTHKTTMAGDYRFCFDNTHTRYSRKSVSLRLEEVTGSNWEKYNKSDLAPDENYDGKLTEIVGFIDRVRVNLNEMQSLQQTHRHIELRDRQTAESNFDKVNWYSLMCLICTLTVMLIQVISLRSFFDDKSAVRRFFKQTPRR